MRIASWISAVIIGLGFVTPSQGQVVQIDVQGTVGFNVIAARELEALEGRASSASALVSVDGVGRLSGLASVRREASAHFGQRSPSEGRGVPHVRHLG